MVLVLYCIVRRRAADPLRRRDKMKKILNAVTTAITIAKNMVLIASNITTIVVNLVNLIKLIKNL
jgi:hypothetical protein